MPSTAGSGKLSKFIIDQNILDLIKNKKNLQALREIRNINKLDLKEAKNLLNLIETNWDQFENNVAQVAAPYIDDEIRKLLESNEKIKAYGTEVGAFVRLDDLQPGFAFGNIDRSIIMSPQKTNARAVLPITTMEEILYGYHIDYLLYANNYEDVDENKPLFEEITSDEDALRIFGEGARMAKGTTNEKGLVKAYFANIFGPPLYKELHDALAEKYFKTFFNSGIKLAQLRTRLGISGYETKGPEMAAKALFEKIIKEE